MADERYDAKSRTFWGRCEGHEDKGSFNQLNNVMQKSLITQKDLFKENRENPCQCCMLCEHSSIGISQSPV